MKDSIKKILKILAVVLAFALIISSVFIIRSCSAPPDYDEIRDRVEELIEASFDVNDIVWGEGLPTYPRVTKPIWSVYKGAEEQSGDYYYYFVDTNKKDEKILAFRELKNNDAPFSYAVMTSQPTDVASLAAIYPATEGVNVSEELYTEIYSKINSDASKNVYLYLIPYVEKNYDFYYLSTDPEDYDFVRTESKYAAVDAIKTYVRTVYSSDYADSLDAILFDGVMEGNFVQKARYTNYQSARGLYFTSLNTFKPLFSERRVYNFDTAKIDRSNSNDSTVVIEFDTYLPSTPEKHVVAKLTFVLQGDVWYLASPTY